MRKLIQVYEEESIRNIGALMCLGFSEAIFLFNDYTNTKNMSFLREVIKKYTKTKVSFYKVDERKIDLFHIVNENTYFNLNGPNNLLNIRLSMYVQENKFNSFYLFTNDQKIISLYNSEVLLSCVQKIHLSIEDVININGSSIINQNHYQPDIHNKSLIKDILSICEVMKKDFNHWNRYISKLSTFISMYPDGSYIPINKKTKGITNDYITKELDKLNILMINGNKLKFKSARFKKLFKSSGAWLEYYTCISLQKAKYFDDVRMSLVIDFDGDVSVTIDDKCEIDVICLKGLKPVFISNKAGKLKQEALYEIVSHARMFGDTNGIPVICMAHRVSDINPGLYRKAQELGIYVIDYDDIINNKIAERVIDIVNDRYKYK